MYRSSHFEVSSSAVLTAFTLLCGHHCHHLQGFPISQLKLHIRWTLTFPAFPQLLATTVLPTVSRSLTPLGPHLSGILGACPLLTGLLTELGTLKVHPCCNMCQKFLFFFFFLRAAWCMDVSSLTRDRTCNPCSGTRSLNAWATGRSRSSFLLKAESCFTVADFHFIHWWTLVLFPPFRYC